MTSKAVGMEYNLREISANKSVSFSDFSRGLIDFNFSIGAPQCFIPKKSYFKITLQLKGRYKDELKGLEPLKTADGIALADDCAGSLFNNAYFRMSGQDVSVVNNYVAQASILKQRLGKSNAWSKSAGQSLTMLESDFAKRLSKTTFAPTLENNKKVIVPVADGVSAVTAVSVSRNARAVVGVGTTFQTILRAQGCANLADDTVKNASIVIEGRVFEIIECTTETNLAVSTTDDSKQEGKTDCYFICESPQDGEAKSTLDIIYQPPLGIFDLSSMKMEDEVLTGDFRISLNPNTNYKSSVVECLRKGVPSNAVTLVPADPIDPNFYDVQVVDIKFYACYCKMALPATITKQLSLSEMMIMSKPLSGATNTYEFSVPSSTTSLAVWFQSSATSNNPLYPASKFTMLDNKQNNLKAFQIMYAGQNLPSTKWTSSYGLTNNELVQRYRDNMSENGHLYSGGGCETLSDFLTRGLYILYTFTKDQNDRSTQVQVSVDFSGAIETNASIYLCAMYDKQTEYVVANGSTVSIRQSN